ncbi:MAG: hypothetical protein A3K19_21840 [Lentisphaerae bacterium RIFOXYB12_FULL_65_16]|nr:MAG: hypothetical protein A3K18_04410 [Lentisphaerae bacterium RIFOXYA12_64_32]OGV93900.1 MAG: hypothetical protein A3K19_21840 [Lentisphaerae bacterium RIFOXYB12_FULL_65_16]
MDDAYVNYQKASVEFDGTQRVFSCAWGDMGDFLRQGCVAIRPAAGQTPVTCAEFGAVACKREDLFKGRRLVVTLTEGPAHLPELDLVFVALSHTIELSVQSRTECDVELTGDLHWGATPATSTFAVRLDRKAGDLRVGCGPAVSSIDNALFDRRTDAALEATGPLHVALGFEWQKHCHSFRADSKQRNLNHSLTLTVHENYFARKFFVPYRPVRGETQFKTPPIGWMTWYAVKFNASEKMVLDNARWQAAHLAPYGANCIWVDWEWYHSKLDTKVPELPDINTFCPDPRRYPNGMKHVSDEIRKLGLVPAIWIGPTNDPNRNAFLLEHPDCILAEQPAWCGRWWLDPSHPEVIKTFIPKVFRQLLDWGYEAFKWDIIPMSLWVADQHHAQFRNPAMTSDAAVRGLVQAARDVIGPARYMMSCSGHMFRDITLAIDLFDGGRIGGDIFNWEEYVKQAVERAFTYLCFNNILFYADMDNVVIRDEFNTLDQATSRVSFTAMTGTPVTLGDHLPALQPERVELLRRIMPVLDIHPMDLDEHAMDAGLAVLNLVVAKPFEQWNVIDVFNTTGDARHVRIDLATDLHLAAGSGESYLVYDFWQKRFLGTHNRALELDLAPFASTVLCIRRQMDRPQLLSTSRHISQGGHDLVSVHWDADRSVLTGTSQAVGGEPYTLTLHVPTGFATVRAVSEVPSEFTPATDGIVTVTLRPHQAGQVAWSVVFQPRG